MTKTIEPLRFNIRRLEKKCDEILAKIKSRLVDGISSFTLPPLSKKGLADCRNSRDHNDYARAMNSGVRDHNTSLESLYDLENKISLTFPRMVGGIRRPNSAVRPPER